MGIEHMPRASFRGPDFKTEDSRVLCGPHEYAPLKRWRNRGRCRSCMRPEGEHPAAGWNPARAYHDYSEAIAGVAAEIAGNL